MTPTREQIEAQRLIALSRADARWDEEIERARAEGRAAKIPIPRAVANVGSDGTVTYTVPGDDCHAQESYRAGR